MWNLMLKILIGVVLFLWFPFSFSRSYQSDEAERSTRWSAGGEEEEGQEEERGGDGPAFHEQESNPCCFPSGTQGGGSSFNICLSSCINIRKLNACLPTVHINILIPRLQMPPGWGGIGQVGMPAAAMPNYSPSTSQVPADTESRVPVINLKDGTRLAGDDAPRKKDLEQWLNEHPGFVADTGAFIPVSPSVVFLSSIQGPHILSVYGSHTLINICIWTKNASAQRCNILFFFVCFSLRPSGSK